MEPKTPEDIYKSHLDNNSRSAFGGGGGGGQVDSARQNLASSFVNGLVNAAFGQDKLLMDDGNKWLYKNKEHGLKLFFFHFLNLLQFFFICKKYGKFKRKLLKFYNFVQFFELKFLILILKKENLNFLNFI